MSALQAKTVNSLFTDKKIALTLLAAMLIYLVAILVLSPGTFDYGDGLSHYFISRYSWQHPYLFLNDWGKPLFTILSSPFAQFGLKGITLFNIFCGLTAAFIAYKIATKLGIPVPYFAIIFTCSAPIYISVMNSGLTEPLFSVLLIGCIWLCMNERYYTSALIFSFLPFVRPEYIFVLPLFVIYYLVKRKYFALLWLPMGTIAFSIAGAFYYKDIFWVISKNPYSLNNGAYADAAKGNLLSYVHDYHNITGKALAVLLILGLVWYLVGQYWNRKEQKEKTTSHFFAEEIILIVGSTLAIFAAHSIIWGLGIVPTLGLDRYMSTPIPLASVIALRGLQLFTLPMLRKTKLVSVAIGIIFSIFILRSPYKIWYKIPFQRNQPGEVIAKAVTWLKSTKYANRKVFYLAPYITVCLDVDPYNFNRRGELWSMNPQHPEEDMKKGDILIWDAHFGGEEGRMNIDTLLHDPHLSMLNVFKPKVAFKVIGNRDYAVYIFKATGGGLKE